MSDYIRSNPSQTQACSGHRLGQSRISDNLNGQPHDSESRDPHPGGMFVVAAPTAATDTMNMSGDAFYGFPAVERTSSSTQVQGPLHVHLSAQALPSSNATSDRSLTSVSSAVVVANPPEDVRKSKLAENHKVNLERSFDLILEAIILEPELGWDNSTIDMRAKECLSQACAENEDLPATPWNKNMRTLLVGEKQNFRTKMWSAGMPFASRYHLEEKVKSQGLAPSEDPVAVTNAARELCEQMLDEHNWNIYYLHNPNGNVTQGNILFANPILHDFHKTFWYQNSASPLKRLDLNKPKWATTPTRLLACSATALACALRRVAHGAKTTTTKESSQNAHLRYSVKHYAEMEAKILGGMRQVLERVPDDVVRRGFENMLFNLHQQGLAKLPHTGCGTVFDFFIPSLEELTSLQPYWQTQPAFFPHGALQLEGHQESQVTPNHVYNGQTQVAGGSWMLNVNNV